MIVRDYTSLKPVAASRQCDKMGDAVLMSRLWRAGNVPRRKRSMTRCALYGNQRHVWRKASTSEQCQGGEEDEREGDGGMMWNRGRTDTGEGNTSWSAGTTGLWCSKPWPGRIKDVYRQNKGTMQCMHSLTSYRRASATICPHPGLQRKCAAVALNQAGRARSANTRHAAGRPYTPPGDRMYATDVRQTDVRRQTASSLNAPWAGP